MQQSQQNEENQRKIENCAESPKFGFRQSIASEVEEAEGNVRSAYKLLAATVYENM